MSSSRTGIALAFALALSAATASAANAQVKPGDVITAANASQVANLVSPGNYYLVRQGMAMKIVASSNLEWPPPYKAATEQYSPQVALAPDGQIRNYRAGLPFPTIDPNDPAVAMKIMWNFEFRPLYSDDLDARDLEISSHRPGSSGDVEQFILAHLAFYKSVGRTEVAPMPIDNDIYNTGIAYRSGAFPFLSPAEFRGAGIIRQGSVLPGVEDVVWEYSRQTRRLRRLPATELSDAFGIATNGGAGQGAGGVDGASTYASTLDPDSTFGFSAKISDFTYRFLGERQMLASVHAENVPAIPCANDNGRSICPENWEMRNIYVIEATAKPHTLLGEQVIMPKRVLYIDSEGWFITAADQFNPKGELWKTIAAFHSYRDRATPSARVAIWPFKRMFQTGEVDEDLTSGFSTTVFTPRTEAQSECWYINMGAVDKDFFTPENMVQMGH